MTVKHGLEKEDGEGVEEVEHNKEDNKEEAKDIMI